VRATACAYCHTRFAVVGSESQPALRPATLPPAPMPEAQPAPAPRGYADTDNGRGCLMAALMWFVIGPLLVFALFVPVALLLPTNAEGQVQISESLAGCLSLLFFGLPLALTIYAFVYFRQRGNRVLGFVVAPVRALTRRLRR
jgi:hypothetical protein